MRGVRSAGLLAWASGFESAFGVIAWVSLPQLGFRFRPSFGF